MKTVKLSSYIKEFSIRNKNKEITDVCSVSNNKGIVSSNEYFNKEVYSKDISNYKIVREGMFAYNPSRINVGSIAFNNKKHDIAVSPLYIVFKIDENKIDRNFLLYFLKSTYGKQQIKLLTTGSVRDSLKFSSLKEMNIPIIGIKQQAKIVDTLDLCLYLIKKRKEQLAEMDRLIQSCYLKVISKNVTKRILLEEIVQKITTGKSYSGQEESVYKVLKTSSVSYNTFNPKEFKNLPTTYIPKKEYIVSKGDVLVSRMNTPELVGATAYVWQDYNNLALPDRIWKLETNEKVNNIFLWKTLTQKYIKDNIKRSASGTSGSMKNISQKKFLELPIDLPCISEQNKFATIVEEIEAQKKIMEQSLSEMENNFNALLQKAFKGELFPE